MIGSRPRSHRALPLAVLLAPALALAFIPAAAPAHAAPAARHALIAHPHHQQGSPAGPSVLTPSERGPLVVPSGPVVVTNCSTAGYNHYNTISNDIGLGGALLHGSTITFACNPALGAKVGGVYLIQVPQFQSPAFAFSAGEVASIDGADGGANDVVISGGPTPGTGVRIFSVDDGGNLSLANLTMQNGYANGTADNGTGAAVKAWGNFTATNVHFVNNEALFTGGALELGPSPSGAATVVDTITNSTFTGNMTIDEWGGAIDIGNDAAVEPQTVTISSSTFSNNSAVGQSGEGGAIEVFDCFGAPVNIDHSVFTGNTAFDDGGAIDNDCDNLTVTDSLFSDNSATFAGGAVADEGGNPGVILRSTFAGNSSPAGEGGALYADDPTETVANSTFNGNTAAYGGAIYNDFGMALTADTIAGNMVSAKPIVTAPTAGAGIANAGTLTVQSTIISNNMNLTAGTVVNCGNTGTRTDLGYNLEFSGTSANTCGFTAATDKNGMDPLLGALADNGGPTIGATGATSVLQTMALGKGSPAINQVTSIAVCVNPPVNDIDERSLSRDAVLRGHCDSGAWDSAGGLLTLYGAFPLTGNPPARLGFLASENGSFPGGYITLQVGGLTVTARLPITVTRNETCTTLPCTATITLSGIVSSANQPGVVGDTVTVTITANGTVAGSSITSVSAVVTTPGGATVASATWTAPFPFATKLLVQFVQV